MRVEGMFPSEDFPHRSFPGLMASRTLRVIPSLLSDPIFHTVDDFDVGFSLVCSPDLSAVLRSRQFPLLPLLDNEVVISIME
jgi:hypothetical protein